MAATNPFKNGSISTIIDVDGMAYYIIPKGLPFFRAKKGSRYNINSDFSVLTLNPRAFFGVHNMNRAYIESYEDKYGVIFAFETTRPYKLLALDHPDTKRVLYNRVPQNIKDVLRINYGYTMSGIRNSQLNSDLVLSQYLCDNGYQGYASDFIETDIDDFDPEFMICDVSGIKSLGRITDSSRIDSILQSGQMKKHSEALKAARKGKQKPESPSTARARPMSFAPTNLFASDDSPPRSPSTSALKFSLREDEEDDDDDNKENLYNRKGGLRKRKRRSYKKRKTRTNKRKRSGRTRRRRR